jgi:hypothetical protein
MREPHMPDQNGGSDCHAAEGILKPDKKVFSPLLYHLVTEETFHQVQVFFFLTLGPKRPVVQIMKKIKYPSVDASWLHKDVTLRI